MHEALLECTKELIKTIRKGGHDKDSNECHAGLSEVRGCKHHPSDTVVAGRDHLSAH